ncbi:hypothetical protein HPB49_009402 [Dermacentor silvarum]|uniref:Uncharacterized protein n=1 Tax=Dermacentor silvarum TaxID=543639 RepID=A0ACB8CQP1_DERSI|nr:hypothetical protein HPB49_009402 [Dermacentor silvarum]
MLRLAPTSHFLLGKRATCLPQQSGAALPRATSIDLRRQSRHRQALADPLWKGWCKEYLLILCSAQEVTPKLLPQLQVGDVVLVRDDDSPPILWKLTRVMELLPGRDGVARACCLKSVSGSVISRLVQAVTFREARSL